MGVLTLHAHLNRRAECVRQRTKEMRYQLSRETTDLLAIELALERRVRAAREIDRDLRLRFVHGEQEAVAADARLVAERLAQAFAEREGAILDGVMLVDVQ